MEGKKPPSSRRDLSKTTRFRRWQPLVCRSIRLQHQLHTYYAFARTFSEVHIDYQTNQRHNWSSSSWKMKTQKPSTLVPKRFYRYFTLKDANDYLEACWKPPSTKRRRALENNVIRILAGI